MTIQTVTLGYPRIGKNREVKKALMELPVASISLDFTQRSLSCSLRLDKQLPLPVIYDDVARQVREEADAQ